MVGWTDNSRWGSNGNEVGGLIAAALFGSYTCASFKFLHTDTPNPSTLRYDFSEVIGRKIHVAIRGD